MIEEKTVHDLGTVNGRILVFGGVYSNLQALEGLKKWAHGNGIPPGNIFCTGDVLGYCAQPLETVQMLNDWNIHTIAGNVEIQLRNDEEDCGCDFKEGGRCDVLSRTWYGYVRSKLDNNTREWLRQLPHHLRFTYHARKVTIVHGSWHHTSEFIFRSSPWPVKELNLKDAHSDVILAGHCGLPFADMQKGKHWLNSGALGMPANDGSPATWFLTLDASADGSIVPGFHQLHYDHEKASALMKQEGLPQPYAETLISGLWDNCEILPVEETSVQGRPLLFSLSGDFQPISF